VVSVVFQGPKVYMGFIMTTTIIRRMINAPVDKVFNTVSDIRQFSKAIPHIKKVEFLSDSKIGKGTRFRETRLMKGRESITELEVTEFVENERVQMVADSHGTVWDTVFLVKSIGNQIELTLNMEARSYKIFAKLMTSLMKGVIQKAVEKDMDLVKTFCEK
jgi:carbon monoxide dehydrogenase subunit G